METHKVVSRDAWLDARKALLADEKALSKARDRVAEQRRELPWVKVDKEYVFDTPNGRQTLGQLFDGRSQLIVYHFMFGPGWKEGCPGCSFLADHIDAANLHLAHHDVTLLAVSRAPPREFEPFKTRMGWRFKWVSSADSDFNFDYHVSASEADKAAGKMNYNYETIDSATDELPGITVFTKDDAGQVFHTYSSYARGVDILIGAHNYLDMTPKGRNENTIMDWMKHHDRYERAAPDSCCPQKST
jgi:predicted dithiol-disulfide oxidoreductase (DUF899 family)